MKSKIKLAHTDSTDSTKNREIEPVNLCDFFISHFVAK